MPKKAKRMLSVSAIPAVHSGPVARPVSAKRVHRLRLNWFVVGSVFGVGISFFLNFLITAILLPEYEAVMQRHGEITVAESSAPAVVPNLPTAPMTPPPPTYPRTLALKLNPGETLVGMLIRNRVPITDAHNVVAALDDKINPGKLKAGQKVSVTLDRHERLGDAAAVKELAITLPNLSSVELKMLQDGHYDVAATQEELSMRPYHAAGVVKTSFSQALDDAGVPMSVMNDLIKAYSYDIDFQRDIHPNDKIEVLMDRKVSKDGRVGGYGEAKYAVLTLSGHRHEIYKFKDGDGELAWYDDKGSAVKKSLLRTPIDGARITSGFGMRVHPLLGYSKFHKGVDFGAPQGTPIFAAGDGTIEQRGWVNGYGNFVLIRHNGTYETAYGPLLALRQYRGGQPCETGPGHRLCRHDRHGHRPAFAFRGAPEPRAGQPRRQAVQHGLGPDRQAAGRLQGQQGRRRPHHRDAG